MQNYARVITDDPTDRELDYSIPESWVGKVYIGSRVKVPLRSREILATVVALVDTPSVPEPKIISGLISESPILNKSLLALARWMAEYYCCPVESAIRSLLPEVIRKAKLGFKRERIVAVGRAVSEPEIQALESKGPRQAQVLRFAIEIHRDPSPSPLYSGERAGVTGRATNGAPAQFQPSTPHPNPLP